MILIESQVNALERKQQNDEACGESRPNTWETGVYRTPFTLAP